jgi:hypothetical protein
MSYFLSRNIYSIQISGLYHCIKPFYSHRSRDRESSRLTGLNGEFSSENSALVQAESLLDKH